ncbi:adenosine deaminase [Microlunatus flavus]|uniref:Aminodeoxyfutalosine deaminase n=1 Tax=Microlunatus flavus TaxID=1036181 RepID=A0A1H9AEX1_9ACTN|nr:adenosine deaminase [Microlunatus flavus]SEP75240.1 aminodeoxyfutalosine deaminase [Microlunatus flavus]
MTDPAATTRTLDAFIAGLPKAELHVHQVGSASPRIVAQLAERHPGTVPADPEALVDYFRFDDFAHFIAIYLSVVELVETAEDVRLLTYEVAREMAGQQVRYAELTVTPYLSVGEKLPAEAFLEAIEDARTSAERDFGVRLRWIFDIPADFGIPAAEATASIALDHDVPGLVGFGIGGSEEGFPRSMFRDQFDRARAHGLGSVPHAGETTGPATVWDAIETLGAQRIEHGISAAQDPDLMAYLAENDITLDVCPTSNVALKVVDDLASHPLPTLVAAGVPVSINTDDPPMFGTDLNGEYAVAARLLDLDETGLARLARAAVDGAFIDETTKTTLRGEIDAYTSEWDVRT